jgi:mRNA interferase MazF
MPYSRGDVLLARFPYADLTRFKKRPCLLVQDDAIDTGLSHQVVVQISSNLDRTGPTRLPVEKNSEDGQSMGILSDSVVVTDQIQTVEAKAIDKAIGRCQRMDEVDAALKTALGLSCSA